MMIDVSMSLWALLVAMVVLTGSWTGEWQEKLAPLLRLGAAPAEGTGSGASTGRHCAAWVRIGCGGA